MAGLGPFTVMTIFLSPNSANSVKAFKENSNVVFRTSPHVHNSSPKWLTSQIHVQRMILSTIIKIIDNEFTEMCRTIQLTRNVDWR